MHRRMRDELENVLSGPLTDWQRQHLEECAECREDLAAMREQAALIRGLRASSIESAPAEPAPGFYARVMERIEAQGAGSVWSLFFDSRFGRRLAIASMALALCLGVYLVSSEQHAEQTVVLTDDAGSLVLTGAPDLAQASDPDGAVLVNLVTYREQ